MFVCCSCAGYPLQQHCETTEHSQAVLKHSLTMNVCCTHLYLYAGYPLELHCVTTADGYVLRLERIPRTGCSRVAFFLHGILDTSLTWVSSGVTGSQAFAAWDQGFDVWLGSSRSNPPRIATGAAGRVLGRI
jgi:hypothetical protein